MDRETLFSKLKKLFARANHKTTNENEAKACMLKAQRLMAKYNIEMSEVAGMDTEGKAVYNHSLFGYKRRIEWWLGALGKVIADNFKCYCYMDNDRKTKGVIDKSLQFVGTKDNVEIAKEVFYYAYEMIEYHNELYITNYKLENPGQNNVKRVQNDYIKGYLTGMKLKFDEQREKNKQEWGLVLVREKEVDDFISKNLNLRKSNRKFKGTNDVKHYNSGIKQGKKFNVIAGHVEGG